MKRTTSNRRRRGQIVARGENRFLVRVFAGLDPSTGKRTYRSQVVHGTQVEAEKALTALQYQVDNGQLPVEAARMTVAAYLDHWLDTAARPKLSPSTLRKYRQMVRDYVVPIVGSRELVRLTPLDVQHVYGRLLGRGLSARTVRYCHAVLSSALKQAVRWQMIQSNPASSAELPKQRQREMLALTAEEARRFLRVSQGNRYHAFFAVLLLTGVRASEARALTWADVDLTESLLYVRRSVHDTKDGPRFAEPKTRRSRRSIAMPDDLVAILAEHRARRCPHGAAASDLVFATSNGNPVSHSNLYNRHFTPLAQAAGLPEGFRMHDLRHTHASLLLRAGIHAKVVSERLGHASITLTLDTYSHVLPGMQAESAERLSELLFPAHEGRRQHASVN